MAAAALAYKCVEVAYMRVIYSSHSIVTRDRHELQTALQMIPPGNYIKDVIEKKFYFKEKYYAFGYNAMWIFYPLVLTF